MQIANGSNPNEKTDPIRCVNNDTGYVNQTGDGKETNT